MLKQLIKSALRSAGLEVRRITSQTVAESDAYPFEADWISGIANFVNPYTMTSPERLEVLCRAVAHIGQHAIKGDFVECGVWRGGSMMAAALTLMHYQDANRRLYLYDTFQGMTEPTDIDVEARSGKPAKELMKNPRWPVSPLEDVKRNMALTGYPSQLVHYVVGKVEDTIPSSAPDEIALLRLDTDWYHSTAHELRHLWPRLVKNGILIIDDYGHWTGARKAVDEFLEATNTPIFLNKIDYTGRLVIKPE